MSNYKIIVSVTGTKIWKLGGRLHRVDGPAIESSSGIVSWWLNGEYLEGINE